MDTHVHYGLLQTRFLKFITQVENTYRPTCVIAVEVETEEVEIVAVVVVIVEDMMIEEVAVEGEMTDEEEDPRFGRTIDAEEIEETIVETKDEEILVLLVVVTRDGKISTSP